jgi:hypothetical protein
MFSQGIANALGRDQIGQHLHCAQTSNSENESMNASANVAVQSENAEASGGIALSENGLEGDAVTVPLSPTTNQHSEQPMAPPAARKAPPYAPTQAIRWWGINE